MKALKMKPFKNEEEYQMAVVQLEKLGDQEGFEDNDELVNQFGLLANLIEAYENEHANISIGNPIEIIKLKMAYMGLKAKDLLPYMGSSGVVSEVLNKKRALSKTMIRKLSEFLHIDQEILNTKYDLVKTTGKPTKEKRAAPKVHAASNFVDTVDFSRFKNLIMQRGTFFQIGC